MMTHRSKKPFECKFDGCDKSYCDARSLRRHLENHHQQIEAALAANGESKSFLSDANYLMHQHEQFGQQLINSDIPRSPTYMQQGSPSSSAIGGPASPTRKMWSGSISLFE